MSRERKKILDDNLTLVQLRAIAKERELTGYTKLLKKDLIALLNTSVKEDKITVKTTATVRHDNKYEKVIPQRNYTEEFLSLKKEGPTSYIRLAQLGKPGKEGTVFLVSHPDTMKKYAMKTFRKKKSGKTLEKEAFFQYLASRKGISPKIIEYNPEEKYIVMETLNRTLMDIVKTQGTLTDNQQKQILELYRKLDSIGVMLNDANPLNIMEKDGRLYTIDYGFSKFTDHKDFNNYSYPNSQLMPLGLLLWMKTRYPTKTWTIIRNSISPEVRLKMKLDEWE